MSQLRDDPEKYVIREVWGVHTNYPRWLSVNVCGHFLSSGHVCPRRTINDYLLIACVGGHGVYEIEGEERTIQAGDLYVALPGVRHAYHSDPAEGWDIWWAHFTGTLAPQLLQQAGFQVPDLIRHRLGRRLEPLQALLRRLCSICASGNPTMEAESSACLYELLLRLAQRDGATAEEEELGRRLLDALEAHPESVEAMAQAAGMSKFHYIREFRRHFHLTPWRYVIRRRIAQARELLVTTDYPIKRIAQECGFADANFFSYVFRRETGQAATAFRTAYLV